MRFRRSARPLLLMVCSVAAWLMWGCGRIGVELLPIESPLEEDAGAMDDVGLDASTADAGAELDAADSDAQAAIDAQSTGDAQSLSDATSDAPDDGQVAVMPDTGAACPNGCSNDHGSATCVDGTCMISCAAGFDSCDGDSANGCETPLSTVSDCGGCGVPCTATDGVASCGTGQCTTSCDLTGALALKLTVPATWSGSSVLSSGSGTFSFWALLQTVQSGTSLSATVIPCGETVPDFRASAIINEQYGITFASAAFDTAPMAGVASSGSLGTVSPGASLSFGPSAFLMGARLNNPATDAWPSAASLVSVDGDGDGKAGVTGGYKNGSGYSWPPADGLAMTRAQQGYIATRLRFSLNGAFSGCSMSTGTVTTTGVDVHTLGCRVTGGSRDCNQNEANYLDQNAPTFTSQGGTYSLAKIATGAGCAAVRAALP